MYLLYYATQALHQASGKEWQTWNEAVRDFLVKPQQPGPGWRWGVGIRPRTLGQEQRAIDDHQLRFSDAGSIGV